jgi:hypothetical protein
VGKHTSLRQACDRHTGKHYFARGWFNEFEDCFANRRLAAAGFADKAQSFAITDAQIDPVYRVHAIMNAAEETAPDGEIFY